MDAEERVRIVRWEDEDYIVEYGGRPVGHCIGKREAGRVAAWATTAIPEIEAEVRRKVLEDVRGDCAWADLDGWWAPSCLENTKVLYGIRATESFLFCPYCGRVIRALMEKEPRDG